jgi:transposase
MGKFECDNCVRLQAEFAAYVERTEKRIKDLEEKLSKNSSNSSIPPSANPPGSKKPTGRKPGG